MNATILAADPRLTLWNQRATVQFAIIGLRNNRRHIYDTFPPEQAQAKAREVDALIAQAEAAVDALEDQSVRGQHAHPDLADPRRRMRRARPVRRTQPCQPARCRVAARGRRAAHPTTLNVRSVSAATHLRVLRLTAMDNRTPQTNRPQEHPQQDSSDPLQRPPIPPDQQPVHEAVGCPGRSCICAHGPQPRPGTIGAQANDQGD